MSIFGSAFPQFAVQAYAAVQALLDEGEEPPFSFTDVFEYARWHFNVYLSNYDLMAVEREGLIRMDKSKDKKGGLIGLKIWPLEYE